MFSYFKLFLLRQFSVLQCKLFTCLYVERGRIKIVNTVIELEHGEFVYKMRKCSFSGKVLLRELI